MGSLSRLQDLAVVDDSGAVIDRIVEDGMLQGVSSRTFRLVILDFIAKCVGNAGESCGDGYPLNGLSAPNRADVENLGTDPGASSFAGAGSEQDALAEYLVRFFPADASVFEAGENEPVADNRIQNLGLTGKSDTVFDLPASGAVSPRSDGSRPRARASTRARPRSSRARQRQPAAVRDQCRCRHDRRARLQ
ncbi:MAG: hypothetical protein U5K73_03465 [Halofilum sp. (in: g-proteobacteria)]|nr:hypothetical protein [Halofilum sp. (in: g-proteobacteria)]